MKIENDIFDFQERHATLVLPLEEIILKGNWLVDFNWDDDYWEIYHVHIEGINL